MTMIREERLSDSPFVEKIGRFRVEGGYSHVCPADVVWSILHVNHKGISCLSVWGPETKSAVMTYPDGAEFMFIHLKLGTFMPKLPKRNLVDTGIILPDATGQAFWLDSAVWQFPDYENADTFVDWLVREELLVHESLVDDVLQDYQPQEMSPRTVRHRFLRATGLTKSHIHQIERARQAAALLERGVSILDVVDQCGYADQPHMTRSFKRFIGQTPAQIARLNPPE